MQKLIWMLFLLGSIPALLFGQIKMLQGVVRDKESSERLPNATVLIQGTRIGTKTNLEGVFTLTQIPDSSFTLVASFVGYQDAKIRVERGKSITSLEIKLVPTSFEANEVTVSAQRAEVMQTETTPSLITIAPAQLAKLPNVGQVDILRSLALLPGVSGTNDGSSGMYVRGGTPDQNLVLFDGITVYHVDHFFGFFSAFNPDAVKDVQFYKGGYPAQYGGRLSSVVDLAGKAGASEGFRASANLNLLSSSLLAEVPLTQKGSLLIAGRRSYNDILKSGTYTRLYNFISAGQATTRNAPQGFGGNRPGGPPGGNQGFLTTTIPTTTFYDLNAKLTFNLSAKTIWSASVFNSGDDLDKSQDGQTQTVNLGGQTRTLTTPKITDQTTQGNLGVSTRLYQQWSSRFYTNAQLAFSRYTSVYTYNLEREGENSNTNQPSRRNATSDENNKVEDFSLRVDNQLYAGKHEFSFGTHLSQTQTSYNLTTSNPFGPATASQTTLSLLDTANQLAIYGTDTWKPIAPLSLSLGIRTNYYSLIEQWYWEPRASIRYELTPSLALKGAIGRYHQFTNRIINENISEGSRDFWVLSNPSNQIPVGRADHVILGFSYENKAYVFDVEAYRKNLTGLVEFSQRIRRTSDDPYTFLIGDGITEGLEVLLQKKRGRLNGWVGYTLSKAENIFADIDGGDPFSAAQDQRHELKTVANFGIGKGWNLAGTFVFASGKPYTAPVSQYSITLLDNNSFSYIHVGEKNAYRLPAYQRLDLSLSKEVKRTTIHWMYGVSIFNVYNHENVSYYKYDFTATPVQVTKVTGLGTTPTIFLQLNLR